MYAEIGAIKLQSLGRLHRLVSGPPLYGDMRDMHGMIHELSLREGLASSRFYIYIYAYHIF